MPKPHTVVDPFTGRRPVKSQPGFYTVSRAAVDASAPSKMSQVNEPLRSVLGVSERTERQILRRRRPITGRKIA